MKPSAEADELPNALDTRLVEAVVLTREALASTILPVPSETTTMASTCPGPGESPTGPELPPELMIPLPASRACSEDGEDGPTSAGADDCSHYHGLTQSDKSLPQEPLLKSTGIAIDVDIDQNQDMAERNSQGPLISLDELARLLELEQYERHQSLAIRDSLHQLYFSAGLDRRLACIASLTYRRMVDLYKASDQAGFVAIHQAYENLCTECQAGTCAPQIGSRRTAGEDREDSFAESWDTDSSPWIRKLPTASHDEILTFLLKIRTSDGLLSDRILELSPTELTALTVSYQPVALAGSVLQNYSHAKARADGHGRRGGSIAPGLDALRTFYRHDPFFLLLYGVFDGSSKPGTDEFRLRSDTWSTTCARVLMNGKRGSDEFVITTIDAFSGFHDRARVPQLEAFLLRFLHEGAFLLDPPQPTDFKQPVEIRNAQAVIAGSHFFDMALKTLFQILSYGPLEAGVPETALGFAHAILRKIEDPRIRLKAKTIIVSRWYFQCFLSNILVYPESQGILMKHHVGETPRRVILQELAHRMQKVVADVLSPWNHTTMVTPEIQAFVAQVLRLFEPPPSPGLGAGLPDDTAAHSQNLMLCSDDILCLIEFFYPKLTSSLLTTISDGSAPSTASSVTGSSTLITSSVTPSSSGTSIITHDFNGEDCIPVQAPEKDGCRPVEQRTSEIPSLEAPFKGHHLKDSYNRLKEKSSSEAPPVSGGSGNDWTLIYISQDATRLSMDPDGFDEVSLKHRRLLTLENDTNDVGLVKDALARLMVDRDSFQTFALKLGIDTTCPMENRSIITRLFDAQVSNCRASFDFTGAIFWWKASRTVHELSLSQRVNVLDDLLQSISKDLQARVRAYGVATKQRTGLFRSLESLRLNQRRGLQALNDRRRALRIKMWYISDVRHSAAYEDALHVTRALRAMASSSRVKQPGSISTWARHRLRNSVGPDRSESQTLEILTAHKDHGGLSKLADEQIELTSRWLTRNSIENFCKGEERIHRFCFEVQKCVNKLAGVNLLENPVLWSSRLFEREKSIFNPRPLRSSNHESLHRFVNDESSVWSSERFISQPGSQSSWRPPIIPSGTIPSSHITCAKEGWGGARSSVPAHLTDVVNQSRLKSPSGITSVPYPLQTYHVPATLRSGDLHNNLPAEMVSAKTDFTQQIKKTLGSLIISDLGYLLWVHGTETDAWVNLYSPLEMPPVSKNNLEESRVTPDANLPGPQNLLGTSRSRDLDEHARPEAIPKGLETEPFGPSPLSGSQEHPGSVSYQAQFPYKEAYKTLLDRFSYSLDPYDKLNVLSELQGLVSNSLDDHPSIPSKRCLTGSEIKFDSVEPTPLVGRAINVPRTKATILEEVIANCTERRIGTLRLNPFTEDMIRNPSVVATSSSFSTRDSVVLALLDIFRDPSLRPTTLFRDLQYIAAFIPSSILDYTSQGTAFWDAGLAALALKEELCASIVTRATEITNHHINGALSHSPVHNSLATTNLREAANLWLVAAKEGSPAAARELGLFYLTHPELVPRVTLPFSKAKDVFRSTLINDRGVGGSGGRAGSFSGAAGAGLGTSSGGQPGGLDPWTFAVVFHWMEVAANGGDRDASDFLRGNGELSGGR